MHAVFLYHAIKNGMTMGIVNAGAMPIYEDIPQPMRDYIEEVVLNESADGGHVERLLKFAEEEKERKEAGGSSGAAASNKLEWRRSPSTSASRTRSSRASPSCRGGHGGGAQEFRRPLEVIEGRDGGHERRRRPLRRARCSRRR